MAVKSIRWAYGVTTVPGRIEDLLPRTLESLKAAGFDRPRLFVDGAPSPRPYEERFPGLAVTVRNPRLRTYGNWIISLAELYVRDPNFDRYALFQDDFVTCRNLREYLERRPFPEDGYGNLYTFMENEQVIDGRPPGWVESQPIRSGRDYHGKRQQGGRGAVALVFTRKGVLDLLTHQHVVHRPQDVASGWKRVDGAVVEAMNRAGYREYVHNPSLVQHTGRVSSMGNIQRPPAKSFRGEEFDCLTLLEEKIS